MKVLILSSLYEPNVLGGSEKMAQLAAESLLAAGHVPVVISLRERRGVQEGSVNGVKVYYLGLRNLYWPLSNLKAAPWRRAIWHLVNSYNPWMASAVDDIVSREQPDIVNTHNITGFSAAVWPAMRRRGLKIVHTVHDCGMMCPKAVMFRGGRTCDGQCTLCAAYTFPAKRASACVDSVIGVSRFILDCHLRAGYFSRASSRKVIYNAYDGSPPSPQEDVSQPLRIGFVGRLVAGKGIEWLMSTFQQLAQTGARLLIAGEGEAGYVHYLKARYGGPQVSFLGFVQPSSAFSQMDVLVAPSLWNEALGNVVFEAYMHGLPAIVSDQGGLPEMVDNGRTGFICPAGRPESLKAALLRFITEPELARRMRPAILEYTSFFRAGRFASEYVDCLIGAQAK